MPNIPVGLLAPGMSVCEDVVNRRGQVLLPAGTEIGERHLRGLKMWGIDRVAVDASQLPTSAIEELDADVSLPSEDEVDDYISKSFHLNGAYMEHPFMKTLISVCRARFLHNGFPNSVLKKEESTQCEATQVLPEESSARPTKKQMTTMDHLLKNNANLASPPDVYVKLMEAMDRAGSSSGSIASVISNDPALTARLLRIVNSAYYSFPSPIETISRAITIVGTDELRDMALITSVIKSFSASLEDVLDMNQFWKHSIACALFSKQLAMVRNDQNVERFFTMGLLHDIGRLLMYLQMSDVMEQTVHVAMKEGVGPHEMERAIIGFTHTQVGAELADAWKLSQRQKEAIKYHHRPQLAKRFPLDAAVLHIADFLANGLAIGNSGSVYVPEFVPEAWDRLHLSPEVLGRIEQEVQMEVAELVKVFCGSEG